MRGDEDKERKEAKGKIIDLSSWNRLEATNSYRKKEREKERKKKEKKQRERKKKEKKQRKKERKRRKTKSIDLSSRNRLETTTS